MILITLLILAVTPPTEPATWGNLIPWIISFCGAIISGVLYHILIQQNKRLDAIDERLNKMGNALFLSQRARLIQLSLDASMHPMMQEQCKELVKEIDESTRPNK